MSVSATDRQFLYDWAHIRGEGQKRYAEKRSAIAFGFAIWGGVNLAVRMPLTPALFLGTLAAAIGLSALVFFASRTAFATNDKRFATLTQAGEPIPESPPRKDLPRNALIIGVAVAATLPIIAPAILRMFLK